MAGTFVRRKFALPLGEERLFRVDAETQLKAYCHWHTGKPQDPLARPGLEQVRRDLPVLVIVHGLEGSSESNYIWGVADKAWARGFHAVRLNQRN